MKNKLKIDLKVDILSIELIAEDMVQKLNLSSLDHMKFEFISNTDKNNKKVFVKRKYLSYDLNKITALGHNEKKKIILAFLILSNKFSKSHTLAATQHNKDFKKLTPNQTIL